MKCRTAPNENWLLRRPSFERVLWPAYLRHRITNTASESINAKIQWLKCTARGFRNRQNFVHAIYFHCGGLGLALEFTELAGSASFWRPASNKTAIGLTSMCQHTLDRPRRKGHC
jgi:hypothetical protein